MRLSVINFRWGKYDVFWYNTIVQATSQHKLQSFYLFTTMPCTLLSYCAVHTHTCDFSFTYVIWEAREKKLGVSDWFYVQEGHDIEPISTY